MKRMHDKKEIAQISVDNLVTSDVVVKTLRQTTPNYEKTLTPSSVTGFTLVNSFCVLNWVNDELHLVFCAAYQNTSGGSLSFGNYDQYIGDIPSELGEKIVDMAGKKLTEEAPATTALRIIRCAPMGQTVYGSTSRVVACELIHTSQNQMRINALTSYTVPNNAYCIITLEINLTVI